MSEDYWDGGTWVYQADITNDAMDAANQIYTITPGVGNEMEVLYGSLFNGDTSARNGNVRINDPSANLILHLANESVTAGAFIPVLSVGPSNTIDTHNYGRVILSGAMRLVVTITAVAVSEDSALGLVCRIRGSLPLVIESASAGTPVISINTEQVL